MGEKNKPVQPNFVYQFHPTKLLPSSMEEFVLVLKIRSHAKLAVAFL